jgi:hypothetical protein
VPLRSALEGSELLARRTAKAGGRRAKPTPHSALGVVSGMTSAENHPLLFDIAAASAAILL